MNYAGLGVCIGLIVFIAAFVLYLFVTPTTYIESPKPDVSYHPLKDTYSGSNNAENKTQDFKTSNDFNKVSTNNNNDNNSSDFNNNTNTGYNLNNFNNNNYNNPSDFNNNTNTGYNSNTNFNNNAGGYSSSDFAYGGGGNIYSQPLNPSQQQSAY